MQKEILELKTSLNVSYDTMLSLNCYTMGLIMYVKRSNENSCGTYGIRVRWKNT